MMKMVLMRIIVMMMMILMMRMILMIMFIAGNILQLLAIFMIYKDELTIQLGESKNIC